MNNLATGSFLFLGLTLLSSLPGLAAGSDQYRDVISNNLFECSTNQQIEMMWSGGSSTSIASEHTLICLDGYRKAKWVMTSRIICQSPNIVLQECPIWFNNDHIQKNKPNQLPVIGDFTRLRDPDNTNLYYPKKTGIGTDCKIVSETSEYGSLNYSWSCKNYAFYKNRTIITKGKEPLLWSDDLYRKYNRIPSQFQLETSNSPNCNPQSTLECAPIKYPGLGRYHDKLVGKFYIDCRGDAMFCHYD